MQRTPSISPIKCGKSPTGSVEQAKQAIGQYLDVPPTRSNT